jgi:protein gp37
MSTKISYLNHPPRKGELWSTTTGCSGKGCACQKECWAKFNVDTLGRHVIHGWDSDRKPIPFSKVAFHPERLDQPLHWREPRRVGVCFMGDWMDGMVKREWIKQILQVIKACTSHQFFTLTKQSQHLTCIPELLEGAPVPENLWNGVSICNQPDLDSKVMDLLRIPGHKWLSIEPMMGPIDFRGTHCLEGAGGNIKPWCDVDLVVIGCHSNPRKYPCPIEWVESVVYQCRSAGVKVYVKQIDINGKCIRDFSQFPARVKVREMP